MADDLRDIMDSLGDDHELHFTLSIGQLQGTSFAPNIEGVGPAQDGQIEGYSRGDIETHRVIDELLRVIKRATSDGSYTIDDFRFTLRMKYWP